MRSCVCLILMVFACAPALGAPTSPNVIPTADVLDNIEATIGVQTHFGPMSTSMKSSAKSDKIEMTTDPPTHNAPRAIYARFRRPELQHQDIGNIEAVLPATAT